ncbi:MAG: TolC family protein [Chryseolinea sp.]
MLALKKYIVPALFALIGSITLHAQDTLTLSLEEIIIKVEREYPLMLQYDSRIKSLQSKVEGSKSWMPPTFSFGLNSFPYQLEMIKRKEDPMNWAAFMFSAEQMIPNSAKLRAKGGYYSSLKEVQENNSEWTKNILRTQVRILYYQRLVADQKIELIGESGELLHLFITISESRYTYNQSDLSTIFKAKGKLKELNNMEIMAKAEVTESNIGLNTLMNLPTDTPILLDTSVVLKNYDSILHVQDTASLQRSDITSMNSNIRSMELNRHWMATGSKPDFGLRISHMNMLGMPNQFSIMGMVTIPIVPWTSKMYKTEVQSMNYEIQAMNFEKENMKLMAVRMINEKLAMLKYERQQFDNYQNDIVPLYKKSMEVNLLAYKQNTGNFFVLLDAWEMLFMKQLEQLDKLSRLLRLQAEYEYETETQ